MTARNVNRLVYSLYAICAAMVLVELLVDKHGHFGFEGWFGFHAWYGFIACVGLVIAAKGLRKLVMRYEHYYDAEAGQASDERPESKP